MSVNPTGNRGARGRRTNRSGRRTTRRRSARGRARAGVRAGDARRRLRSFRQASFLAIAITAFLLLLFAPGDDQAAAQDAPEEQVEAPQEPAEEIDDVPMGAEELARETTVAFQETVHGLWVGFMGYLPRLLVVLGVLLVAWLIVRMVRAGLLRVLRGWHRSSAFVALAGFAIWALAIGVAVSVLVGDVRALIGSFGLLGLALSWALQTPIESFTGWLMNSFQGYYRPGDRVAVGDIFGDVYRIDFLTTTVWEIGSPERGGFVQAEQPTGRLITFPNNEVLAGSIVNLTRDFPYVWDEITVPVANESDLSYAQEQIEELALALLGEHMSGPAREYRALLRETRLESNVPEQPEVFVNLGEYAAGITIRYLVGARERRIWKTRLARAILELLNDPEHEDRILPVYERHQHQFVRSTGEIFDPEWAPGDMSGNKQPRSND